MAVRLCTISKSSICEGGGSGKVGDRYSSTSALVPKATMSVELVFEVKRGDVE